MPCPGHSYLGGIEPMMKRILIAGLLAILFTAAPAAASLMTFDFTFSGTDTTAVGSITLDMAVLAAPGRYRYDPSDQYSNYNASNALVVAALTVTVSGSAEPLANTTYQLADFDAVLFDSGVLGVDFTRQLVGQTTYVDGSSTSWGWGTWDKNGPTNVSGAPVDQSYTGDFQLFSVYNSNPWSPTGIDPYGLTTGGGEPMLLTSFGPAAVPEPSTYVLLTISLGVVGYARRKSKMEN